MSPVKIHLVGGFLGSGKTTAIIHAAKNLVSAGLKVGIITNDQGKYLVDTAFFRLNNIPTTEVTGGCFCCNYQDLETLIEKMNSNLQLDALFAESVGSCTDLVATVIKPLLQINHGTYSPTSFSVFVDSRFLRLYLLGCSLPFSDNVIYIFRKQIEEAGLLVINKFDLLSPAAQAVVQSLIKEQFPDKKVVYQNSLQNSDINRWIEIITSGCAATPTQSLEIDYDVYANGEMKLAWLDEKIKLSGTPTALNHGIRQLIRELHKEITSRATIGHLKFLIQDPFKGIKISITAQDSLEWEQNWEDISNSPVELLINARVEINQNDLQMLMDGCVENILSQPGLDYDILSQDVFTPGFPNPAFRMD